MVVEILWFALSNTDKFWGLLNYYFLNLQNNSLEKEEKLTHWNKERSNLLTMSPTEKGFYRVGVAHFYRVGRSGAWKVCT